MPMNMSEAFKTLGLRAEYEGNPAIVLPITAENAAEIDQSKVKQGAESGQMLVAWTEGTERKGKVLNADAQSDLTILIKRNDGEDKRISAANTMDAVLEVLRTQNKARDNVADVDAKNAAAEAAYQAAFLDGDEKPEEPKALEYKYGEDAFARTGLFVACVREAAAAIKADPMSDIAIKANVDTFSSKVRELTRDELTKADRAKAISGRELRAQIALLNPDHKDAIPAMPAAYDGDYEASQDMMSALPHDPTGVSAAQASAMAQNGDFNLVRRLFSVATTADVMQIGKSALSHTGFKTIAQELAKSEDKEASDAILPRMAAVMSDAMPDYKWQGKVYSKDGADVLLMRDEYAAFVYTWPTESRVADIDLTATVLSTLTQNDVLSDAEMDNLRAEVENLRHDNGAEVNFDFDEEEEDLDFDA